MPPHSSCVHLSNSDKHHDNEKDRNHYQGNFCFGDSALMVLSSQSISSNVAIELGDVACLSLEGLFFLVKKRIIPQRLSHSCLKTQWDSDIHPGKTLITLKPLWNITGPYLPEGDQPTIPSQ